MKTKLILIIIATAISIFIVWSLMDVVCKPCIIPPNAPENYVCPDVCIPEPRWYSWLR
jgi:hypothetical protein